MERKGKCETGEIKDTQSQARFGLIFPTGLANKLYKHRTVSSNKMILFRIFKLLLLLAVDLDQTNHIQLLIGYVGLSRPVHF